MVLVAKSTETTDKQGGLGDDHLGLGRDHDDLNEDEGGFVEAAHRSKRMRKEGNASKARQGKARVWKLFQRMLSGAQRSSATEKHSEQELSRRRTFRVLDH